MYKMIKEISAELTLLSSKTIFFFVCYLILAVLEGLTDGIGVGLLASFITNMSENSVKIIESLKQTYTFLPANILSSEKIICFTIVALFSLRIFVVMLTANFKCIIPQIITYRIRDKILEKVFSLSLFDIEQKRSGMIINLLTTDAAKMSTCLFSVLDLIYILIIVSIYLLIMLMINKLIFIIGLLLAIPFVIIIRFLIIALTRMSKKLLKMRNSITSNCTERLNNIRFIKSIGTEYQEYKYISNSYKDYRNIEIKRFFVEYFGTMMPQFFIVFMLSAVMYLTIYNNGIYKSFITLYVLPMGFIGMRCFLSLTQLNTKYIKYRQDAVSVSEIVKFWKTNQAYFINNKKNNNLNNFPSSVKNVYFENVSFGYEKQPVIHKFSLLLEKGQPIILKGKSGTGKTTIANLLRMLILPENGKILLNDIPFESFHPLEIRNAVGYVTQEAVMMYGTILENLIYGLELKPDTKKIKHILKQTGCENFINKLPNGIDTFINEKGSNLSGGQKQKLAMARILLRNPSIFIFDEITNNLDMQSKKDIINSVNHISKNTICLIITHDDIKLDNEKIVFLDSYGSGQMN